MSRLVFVAVCLMSLVLLEPAPASSFEQPDRERGAWAEVRLGGPGGWYTWNGPGGRGQYWVGGAYRHALLGGEVAAGSARRLVLGPKYALRLWGEVGLFGAARTIPSAGAGLAGGIQHAFRAGWFRATIGAKLDTAAAAVGYPDWRFRPSGTGALGAHWGAVGDRAAVNRWLPDALWLRGELGYDMRFQRLGAAYFDAWLTLRWSL